MCTMRTMTNENENDENDDLDLFLHHSRHHFLCVSIEISANACLFYPKLVLHNVDSGPGLHWLIGFPSFPPVTIVFSLKCIHAFAPSDLASPNLRKESGFEIIGALNFGNSDFEKNARKSIHAARGLRKLLYGESHCENQLVLGAVAGLDASDIRFFISKSGHETSLESGTSIIYEDHQEKYVWEKGCLLQCELLVKLPVYYAANNPSGRLICFTNLFLLLELLNHQALYCIKMLYSPLIDDTGSSPVHNFF